MKFSTRDTVSAAAFFLTLSALGCAQPQAPRQQTELARAVDPPSRLEPPVPLPQPARNVLKTMMASHRQSMTDLVSAIMVLNYPEIDQQAQAIAESSALARPLTGDATELNTLLPERLFQLQDQMREQARTLSVAAKKERAFDVADAYGRLSQTCVQCHATYRAGR